MFLSFIGFNQLYMRTFQSGMYYKSILFKTFQSYKPAKLAVKKRLKYLVFEATFSRVYVVNSYSLGGLGSIPG